VLTWCVAFFMGCHSWAGNCRLGAYQRVRCLLCNTCVSGSSSLEQSSGFLFRKDAGRLMVLSEPKPDASRFRDPGLVKTGGFRPAQTLCPSEDIWCGTVGCRFGGPHLVRLISRATDFSAPLLKLREPSGQASLRNLPQFLLQTASQYPHPIGPWGPLLAELVFGDTLRLGQTEIRTGSEVTSRLPR
jgi:hypothetical protein